LIMFDASVIICAHNPRSEYLRRALDGLRRQTLPCERWELLLIDNASNSDLSTEFDVAWHPNGRHIAENELGLASARRRGMREASSDLLIFVDDDNVLDPDYLWQAVKIKHDWPILAVWGSGRIIPEFEQQPLPQLKGYLGYLALREVESPRWTNVMPVKDATPWGAGFCVRARVAAAYQESCQQSAIRVTGRRGDALLSGEDVEVSFVACNLGFGVGIFPELRLTHLIPKERVMADYLVRVVEGTHFSTFLLDYKWRSLVPASPLSALGILSVLKNALINRGIDRRMYFAKMRAQIKARRMVTESQRSLA
jgi:glycosyltransferase involved in cell wall biosynthesis